MSTHMIGVNTANALAKRIGAYAQIHGDRLRIMKDGVELGSTLLDDDSFVSRHAIEMIINNAVQEPQR
jgi:hypothetical protein